MGTDIHVMVVKDGAFVIPEMDMARNYTWFGKIQHENDEYTYLNWQYNLENDAIPPEVRKDIDNGCWGFKFCNVAEFVNWFEKYKPDLDAGWIRKREAWLLDNKGVIPYDYEYELPENCVIEDWEFREFPASGDFAEDIITEIKSRPFLDREHSYLVFYFDN